MTNYKKHAAMRIAAAATVVAVGGCNFLTGGETGTDPNRPTTATNDQIFVATQSNLWAFWGSDLARVTGILAQQFAGVANQYGALQATYAHDENTTNGSHAALYTAGGLVDIKKLQDGARAAGDSLYLGVAQVEEGALMGTGADVFGDLVYSQALQGIANPKLDDQFAVYDSVEKVLSAGISNLNRGLSTDVGPGGSDLVYGGDPARWTAMAHTLKARFYMHTAEVKGIPAYQAALAEAQQGIMSDDGDYVGAFTQTASETNFYFQFHGPAGRGGDIGIGVALDTILQRRNDPRRAQYFDASGPDTPDWLSSARGAANFQQPYVTYDENTLIWAEAAFRTGDQVTALAKLNEERANHGLPAEAVAGQTLLNEILIEKYIADFQLGEEAWNDYKRTCTPNLTPTAPGTPIPARLYYDAGERNTDTNIPQPNTGVNGVRNKNDPANATSDGTGQPCLGQF
ncbi:MAG TPA: SusD/RagB family nutrient-binding outer membrane lipoprotein [Gemmatimonadaceae bacterium]|nr:SusD/RagB family nutrient-binding outer membrane lipoprotein [Gemmatimonadaceae bacterium]